MKRRIRKTDVMFALPAAGAGYALVSDVSATCGDHIRSHAYAVDPDIAYAVASVHALEGERDQAFEWLQRSVALGNENKPLFEHDPNLDNLRNNARFEAFMARQKKQWTYFQSHL